MALSASEIAGGGGLIRPAPALRDALILCLWAMVVAVSAWVYVSRFEIDNSVGIWFAEGDPELGRFLATERIFGETEWTVYLVDGKTGDGPELGAALCRIGELPGVERVLAAVPRNCGSGGIPDGAASATGLARRLTGSLEDGRTAIVIATHGPVYAREPFRLELLTRIDAVLAEVPGVSSVARAGTPVVNAELNRAARRDMIVFYAAIALLMAVFGRLFLSTARTVLVLVAILAATILPTLGVAAAAGLPFNLITVMLPTILVAMTASVAIHALREFRHCHLGGSARAAAAQTIAAIWRPALFSALTTAAGFLSLAQSDVAPVRQVGYLAAFGVTLGLINTLVMAPCLLRLLWARRAPKQRRESDEPAGPLSGLVRLWHRPWLVLPLAGIAVAAACGGLALLRADTDYVRFFGDRTRISADYAAIGAAGLPQAQAILAITAPGRRTIDDPATGPALDRLAGRLERLPGIMAALRPDGARVPQSGGRRHARIVLLTEHLSSSRILELGEETALLARIYLPPGMTAELTGRAMLWAKMDTRVIETQRRALIAIVGLLVVLMPVLARSLPAGLAAVVVSVLPVLSILGLMGWLGVTINVATCLIGSVAVGVAVDDTIFLLMRARREMERGAGTEAALIRTLRVSGSAMMTSSLIVASCFLSMTLSDFRPTAQFGLFFAATMGVALAADLVVLPTLLLLTRWRAPRDRGAPLAGGAGTR